MRQRAFTLLELIVVILIVSLLAALLFPIFAQAREKARSTVCLSNLRQLGLAIFQYADDEDSHFPYCGDAEDIDTPHWQFVKDGQYWPQILQMQAAHQFLPTTLGAYVKSNHIWQCPSDIGFNETDEGDPLAAHPSSFAAYGSSYYYRTLLALDGHTLTGLVGYERTAPHTEHGPEVVNILFDGAGEWHDETDSTEGRFNTLFGDGHAASLTNAAFRNTWIFLLDPPSTH